MAEQEKWLLVPEIAGRLGIGSEAVRERIKSGKLKATKDGRSYRIKESDFQQYLKKLEEETGQT